ncbi:PD-(D/E)XK nuclease family protein [Salinibacter ruber]|uniref:PD-(D/E)XK nuclease family protein n=1 Tax=Salinibacter ruber TaxID=146919 RepID=UPI0021674244|nr:PD-(D/E)XK nuclease family protein [Salinibacter ruber]
MSSSQDPADLCGQLQAVCRTHPIRRKILLTPKQESGRSLVEQFVRRGTDTAGLEVATLQQLARRHASLQIALSGDTILAGGADRLVLSAVLGAPNETSVERRVADVTHRMRQIRELRHRDWTEDESDLGDVFARYEDRLWEDGLADGPGLIRRATEALRGGMAPGLEETVLILLPALTTYPDEAGYVDALREAAGKSYSLGEPADAAIWATAPKKLYRSGEEASREEDQDSGFQPGPAARVLRGEPPVGRESDSSVTPVQAATPETEVRYVLRTIKERDHHLDEVEVAYVSSDPYLDLWIQAARRIGRQSKDDRLPVTFGGGIPPRQTRAGRTLLDYFMLVEEGPDSPVLAEMLRNATLRPPGKETDPRRAASIFSNIRPAPTRDGYGDALAALADDPYSPLEEAQLGDYIQLIGQVFDHLPESRVPLRELTEKARSYIDRLGGVGGLGRSADDDGSPNIEKRAYEELTTNLKQIARPVGEMEENAPVLARLLSDLTAERYVGTEEPRPGTLHVSPVEHAGYTGRDLLVVLGLDAVSVSSDLRPRPPLPPGVEEESEGATRAWAVERALARHQGDVLALAPKKKLDTGRTLQPSFAFSQLQDAFGEEPGGQAEPVGFAPGTADQATSPTEHWLWVASEAERFDPSAIREQVEARYPHLLRGREALLNRATEEPEYAGRINPEGKSPLDCSHIAIHRAREKPLSASQLELLAESPYAFFFERVLGAEAPREPSLGDEEWLDRLDYGTLVHEVLEEFMKDLGRPVRAGDWEGLWEVAEKQLSAAKTRLMPPSPDLEAQTRNQLRRDLRAFFRSERGRDPHRPQRFEWEFGYGADRQEIELPGGLSFPLRGSADRIDQLESGGYAVWDYKTSKRGGFDRSDPLGGGETLQWYLYAQAAQEKLEGRVEKSGYYFTSEREQGYLLDLKNTGISQEEVEEHWHRLEEGFQKVGQGVFERGFRADKWTYDLKHLKATMTAGEDLSPRT